MSSPRQSRPRRALARIAARHRAELIASMDAQATLVGATAITDALMRQFRFGWHAHHSWYTRDASRRKGSVL